MDIVGILFKSKIRKKILARFFADESRKFYINEMARIVNTSQGTCRRELNKLADAGFDPVYGARPLKRAIQQQVENPLAHEILTGKFQPGDVIEVGVEDDRLDFQNAA